MATSARWMAKNQTAHTDEDAYTKGNIFEGEFAGQPKAAWPTITALWGGTSAAPVAVSLGTPIVLDNAAGATLTVYANGTFVLDGTNANALSEGEHLNFTFKYMAVDPATGASSYAYIKACVEGHNDGPVAGNDAATTAENAAPATGSVLGNDSDIDRLDTISVTAWSGGALGSAVSLLNGAGATLTLAANGGYVLDASAADALSAGETITQDFTYTLSDNNGATTTAHLLATVTGVNDGPVALNDSAVCIDEDQQASGNVLANDSDIDRLDVLSVAAVNGLALTNGLASVTLASGAVVTMHADGSYTYDTNHAFDSLNTGDMATDSFQYTVADGHGGSATALVSLCVDGVSPPPPPLPDEGLSHGYWKNHTENWNIATNTHFETYFGVDGGDWVLKVKGKSTTLADILFTDALGLQGNDAGKEALARESVAAVLNASETDSDGDGIGINYKYSVAEIVAMVQTAFASGDANVMNATKDTLEAQNTLDLFHTS